MKNLEKGVLSPLWSFSQKGNIWKLLFAGNDILTGETRDIDDKRVYFFSIDIKTGKSLLKNYVFENEKYWIASENAGGRFLFLHRFQSPNLPMHKGIIAIDVQTGEKIWENSELEYIFHTDDGVYAIKQLFESTEIFLLNINTGVIIKKFSQDENKDVYSLREITSQDYFDKSFKYPEVIQNDIINEEISTVEIMGAPEAVIYKDKIIFNYYKRLEDYLENKIYIFDINSKKKLYEDILNRQAFYNVPDSFFLKDEYLFYIKEKNQIVTFKL